MERTKNMTQSCAEFEKNESIVWQMANFQKISRYLAHISDEITNLISASFRHSDIAKLNDKIFLSALCCVKSFPEVEFGVVTIRRHWFPVQRFLFTGKLQLHPVRGCEHQSISVKYFRCNLESGLAETATQNVRSSVWWNRHERHAGLGAANERRKCLIGVDETNLFLSPPTYSTQTWAACVATRPAGSSRRTSGASLF